MESLMIGCDSIIIMPAILLNRDLWVFPSSAQILFETYTFLKLEPEEKLREQNNEDAPKFCLMIKNILKSQ